MLREKELRSFSGWLTLVVLLLLVIAGIALLAQVFRHNTGWQAFWQASLCIAAASIAAVCLAGLTVVNPNEAKVVTLFGVYKGSIKQAGFWWVNPLTTRRQLSLRIRNFES